MAVTTIIDGRHETMPTAQSDGADDDQRMVDAARIVERLAAHFRPGSILDVGCGRGFLLATARDVFRISDIQGIGPRLDPRDLAISAEQVAALDPAKDFDLRRRYDVVVALEVAQHIDPRQADRFVSRLTNHGDAVVFSAAVPGQDGSGSANEQFLDYWQEKFSEQGYRLVDLFRPLFWEDESLSTWCRQNLVLFVNEAFAAKFPWTNLYVGDSRVSLVHPKLYQAQRARAAAAERRNEAKEARQAPGIVVASIRSGNAADEPSSARQVEALERYALLGLGQRRAGDRAAYRFFETGTPPAQDWLDLMELLPALPVATQQKIVKQLVGEGLVALSAMLCAAFLRGGTSPKLLIETYATSLHYIGFGEQALAVLRDSGLTGVDKSVLSIASGILADREEFMEARELISSSGVDMRAKTALLDRVDAVDTVFAELGRLPHGPENGLFVVNLLQDVHRRHAFTARFAYLGMKHTVVKGVRIDDIPEHLVQLLRVRSDNLDGSFGNQLSQYGIWKAIAAGPTPHGVVLEDDGFVRYGGLTRLSFEDLAPDVDIIFLNDRLAPPITSSEGREVGLDPLEDVLAARSFQEPEVAALGSDGYVLSKRGAEKLVHIAETEGFHTVGTDWYLVCHAFDYRRLEELNGDSVMAKVLRSWSARVQTPGISRLTGMVLKPALVEHRPLGTWRSGRVYL